MALLNDSCMHAEYMACIGVHCPDWPTCRGAVRSVPSVPSFIAAQRKALERSSGMVVEVFHDGIVWGLRITGKPSLEGFF